MTFHLTKNQDPAGATMFAPVPPAATRRGAKGGDEAVLWSWAQRSYSETALISIWATIVGWCVGGARLLTASPPPRAPLRSPAPSGARACHEARFMCTRSPE